MVPENLKYTESHEWCLLEGNMATLGVTDYAVTSIGQVVFVDLPEPESDVLAEVPFGELEGLEGVRDLMSPFDGKVVELNPLVMHDPDVLSRDPFGDGWLIRLRLDKAETTEQLLSPAEYAQLTRRRRR